MNKYYLENIRNELPSLNSLVFLNTGTAGPVPQRVADKMSTALIKQLQDGRITPEYYAEISNMKSETRTQVARILGCAHDEIALTRCTSEGLNIVVNGIDWNDGDEVITTNAEHVTGYTPLFHISKRYNVHVKIVDVVNRFHSCVDLIDELITSKTKLITISHVSFCSGDLLPIKEICRVAHSKGVPVLVDGAQAFACIPFDVVDLGCDFYAAPGQKWLCGPEGTGILYVSSNALNKLNATYTGYGSFREFDISTGLKLEQNSRKFEFGTVQPMDLVGLNEACKWMNTIGIEWCCQRIIQLCNALYEMLVEVSSITIVNHNVSSGLLSLKVNGKNSQEIVDKLLEKRIVVRSVPITSAIRISTGFYNTIEELQLVTKEIKELAQ